MISETSQDRVIDLTQWATPASAYPRTTVGRACIGTHYWKKGAYYEACGQGPPTDEIDYRYIYTRNRLSMTDLKIDGEVWMVDDPPHWWSIQRLARSYHGNVLVAGLGLGLIVHALRANQAVKKVVVVERDPDVIQLVRPLVPACEIVHCDWEAYSPPFKPDGIFYDLFVGDGFSLLPTAAQVMGDLIARYGRAKPVHILGFHTGLLQAIVKTMRATPEEVK